MLSGSGLVKCMARIDMDPRPKPLKCAAVSPVLVMARRVSQELVGLVPCPLMAQPDGIPRWHRPEIPVMLVVPLVRDRQALLEGRHQQIGPPPASRAHERKPRLMLRPSTPGHVIGPHVGLVLLLAPEVTCRPSRQSSHRTCSRMTDCKPSGLLKSLDTCLRELALQLSNVYFHGLSSGRQVKGALTVWQLCILSLTSN